MTIAPVLIVSLWSCYPKGWPPQRPGYAIHDFAYDAGPYLVRTAPGRMAVVCAHSLASPPTVQWWVRPSKTSTTAPDYHETSAQMHGELWVAELQDLPPDHEVRYAISSELGLLGPFTFRSDRSRSAPFRFAALGDTRSGHQVHRNLIEQLAREDIDFFINSGDLVEFGGDHDQWIQFFNIEAPLISKRPLFASVGNHDNSQRLYFRRFFLRGSHGPNHRYLTQDWGDLRIILLDSEIEIRPGSAQHVFLEKALREGVQQNMLLIISLHYPPYSSGEHGSNPEVRAVLAPLAKKYGVELILAGHDHNYERTHLMDGTTYIVAASGGAPIRRVIPNDFTAEFRTEPHYILFDVSDHRLIGRALNLQGEVFDDFIIEPNPPRAEN